MSQFYDQASLVMVPSGYKDGKLYSQKPLSTDGELTFSRASTATRVNASGLIESVASGVPRLDYSGGASCPSLLLEPQRTNAFTYSESFDNSAWNKVETSISANSTTSPDGYTNADTFTATNASSSHNISPLTLINLGGVAGTMSVFAKYNGYNISLSIAGSSSAWTGCVFDLQNGVAKTPQQGGPQSVCTAKIEDYGNGWYRCSISYTPYAGGAFYTFIGSVSSATATLGSFGLEGYTGNGTSGFHLYGAQVETSAAYATSYIPTLSTAVTRVADTAEKTGISSLIGQTEGTLFADIKLNLAGSNAGFYALQVYDSSFSPTYGKAAYIEIYQGRVYGYVRNTTVQGEIVSSPYADGTRLKIGFAYKANDFALYVNGVQIGVDTSGTLPSTLNALSLHYSASTQQASPLSQALLFKTRLSNADLATLTA